MAALILLAFVGPTAPRRWPPVRGRPTGRRRDWTGSWCSATESIAQALQRGAAGHDDRGRARRVPRDADAQETRAPGQPRAARRDHPAARDRVRTGRRDRRSRRRPTPSLDGLPDRRRRRDAAGHGRAGRRIPSCRSPMSRSPAPPRGASTSAAGSRVRVVGSDIHDNPGAALAVRAGADRGDRPHRFTRNGTAGAIRRS